MKLLLPEERQLNNNSYVNKLYLSRQVCLSSIAKRKSTQKPDNVIYTKSWYMLGTCKLFRNVVTDDGVPQQRLVFSIAKRLSTI